MKSIIILLFALFTNCIVHSQTQIPKTFQAKVVGIKDGDTFKVLYNNSEITIRLNHIDCPEKNNLLEKMLNGKHLNFVLVKS